MNDTWNQRPAVQWTVMITAITRVDWFLTYFILKLIATIALIKLENNRHMLVREQIQTLPWVSPSTRSAKNGTSSYRQSHSQERCVWYALQYAAISLTEIYSFKLYGKLPVEGNRAWSMHTAWSLNRWSYLDCIEAFFSKTMSNFIWSKDNFLSLMNLFRLRLNAWCLMGKDKWNPLA